MFLERQESRYLPKTRMYQIPQYTQASKVHLEILKVNIQTFLFGAEIVFNSI